MIIQPLIALSILTLVHSWYPQECCSDNDCHPVPCAELVETDKGIEWNGKEFSKDMIKPSQDSKCHVCYTPNRTYCVFILVGTSGPSPQTRGLLGMKEDYLRTNDPTEYTFVSRFVGNWTVWEALLEDPLALPIINKWREELALKLSSEALGRILEAARGETRDALSANKYIYEVLSKGDKANKVGRPSKEAIFKEANKLVEDDKLREEAFKRIFNSDALPIQIPPTD